MKRGVRTSLATANLRDGRSAFSKRIMASIMAFVYLHSRVKEALAEAFKAWLDENRAEIVKVIAVSLPLPAAKMKLAKPKERD